MVDANYGMRGPAISQQQIDVQNSIAIEQTSNENSKSVSLDQTYEGKSTRAKRVLTCQQKSSTAVAAAPYQPACLSAEDTRTVAQLTYEQAKAFAKARKRKERQESVTSICQERKVVRSNSEERPTNSSNNIRRVSSHENFQETNYKDELQAGQSNFQKKENLLEIECEFEKRRSHERFSRPLAQRSKYISQSRRPRSKHFGKKEKTTRKNKSEIEYRDPAGYSSDDNETSSQFLELYQKEKDRSPSPICIPISPALDLTTLHQQIDCTEPLPSTDVRQMPEENEIITSLSMTSTKLLSSPRNSVIIMQRIYLNPDIPQTISAISAICNEAKNPLEYRQKQIAKQISSVKKKMRKYDDDFVTSFGFRPSHADKLNNKDIKKLCSELSRLKKEHTQLTENAHDIGENIATQEKNKPILRNTLHEIEKKLESKRLLAERSTLIEEMTNAQLAEEKIAVQKALLYLESQYGRPTLKEDKDLARPLYDRYRMLKRIVAKMNLTNNVVELATIHEHETMDFVNMPPSTIINLEHITSSDKNRTSNQQGFTSSSLPTSSTTDSSDTDTSIGENLHALTLEELYEQQRNTNEEKKKLRRTLKEFELEFEEKAGRRVQREDKIIMEEVYQSYKNSKAKLKLLDALVRKQSL